MIKKIYMKEQWGEHVNFDEAENLLGFEKLKQQIETHFQKKSKKKLSYVLYWRF